MKVTFQNGTSKEFFLADAEVEVFHGDEEANADMGVVQTIQFIVTLAFNDATDLADWALAPAGKTRFASVDMTLFDRARSSRRDWHMNRAYVYHYQETEFVSLADQQSLALSKTAQESEFRLVIRGILENGKNYDGKNIASIKAR